MAVGVMCPSVESATRPSSPFQCLLNLLVFQLVLLIVNSYVFLVPLVGSGTL